MEPSRRKKRQSSPPSPDLPARFESLNDDTLGLILKFVGNKSYRSFGGINKHCKEIYITSGMAKETFLFGYGPLAAIKGKGIVKKERPMNDCTLFNDVGKGIVYYNRRDVFEWALEERYEYVLSGICNVAAGEGRIDLLNEMWNYMNDEDDTCNKQSIFESADRSAALYGMINVFKWLETKGFNINKEGCAVEAARYGQLHILKWLREVKGLVLDGLLYGEADGHLHILKWLREQDVPWSISFLGRYIFPNATIKGNLEVLQWLHNEGCPWDIIIRVSESDLKPEVIDRCRVNGYGDRLA